MTQSGDNGGQRGSQIRAHLDAYRRRGLKNFVLSAVVGVVTGLVVAGFAWVTEAILFEHLLQSGRWVLYLVAPAVGLTIAGLVVRYGIPSRSPATTEDYIETYHSDSSRLQLRDLPGRLVAAVATIGFGGSMGVEGPSVYAGAVIGSEVQRRWQRWFDPEDAKVLMVAGAAAGIAAVFKAPLTGVIFALETPYTEDLVRRALIPSLISASTSYLAFTFVTSPARLIQFGQVRVEIQYRDLLLAVALGIVCALVARLFILIIKWGGTLAERLPVEIRAPLCGLAVGAIGVGAFYLVGNPVTLGGGIIGTIQVVSANLPFAALPLIAVMKMVSTSLTKGAGGVGGVFLPLVFLGATVGRTFGWFVPGSEQLIFPMVGIAAMVGAGFRSPLAAVAFVAETTGQPGFIIPGLLAAAFAQSLMGNQSISPAQRQHRVTGLERSLRTRCRELCKTKVPVVDVSTPLETFANRHLLTHRVRALPVTDEGTLVGIVPIGRLSSVPRDQWPDRTVGDIMDPDAATVQASDTVSHAAEAMVHAGADFAVVLDGEEPMGIISVNDILGLEQVLRSVYRGRIGRA